MAEVYVNDWDEFIDAIAVSGDTVILPEGAEWDMNEILPDGNTSEIVVNAAKIDGRGTRIKNFHLNYRWNISANNCTIENLLMTDWIVDCSTGSEENRHCAFYCNGGHYFNSCAFSGILSASVTKLSYGALHLYKSSVNIESSRYQFFLGNIGQSHSYSRIELHLPNDISVNPSPAGTDLQFCEIIFYMPNATGGFYSCYYKACTVRGNMSGITSDGNWVGTWSGFPSVFFTEMFDVSYEPKYPQYFIRCTDAQLKTPAYLREKGFPIVVNGG